MSVRLCGAFPPATTPPGSSLRRRHHFLPSRGGGRTVTPRPGPRLTEEVRTLAQGQSVWKPRAPSEVGAGRCPTAREGGSGTGQRRKPFQGEPPGTSKCSGSDAERTPEMLRGRHTRTYAQRHTRTNSLRRRHPHIYTTYTSHARTRITTYTSRVRAPHVRHTRIARLHRAHTPVTSHTHAACASCTHVCISHDSLPMRWLCAVCHIVVVTLAPNASSPGCGVHTRCQLGSAPSLE